MDFYVKDLGDPNFDINKVHSESELAQVLTQIETMLFTNRGEVMGEPDFGANLEDLVYSLELNEQAIQATIRDQLNYYVPLAQKYNTQITVQFYKGNVRDIAQIDVILDSRYQVGVYIN
jgi:phage baseplate assembly protein W